MKSIIIQILAILLLAGLAYGSGITISEKNIDYSYQIEPEPELGQEFTVTVSFSFQEKTQYIDNDNAGAIARIVVFWAQEYISGDTLITGKLDIGETYTLSATYKVIRSGTCYINLNVITKGEADPNGQELKNSYTNTSLFCKEYYIEPENLSEKTLILDSVTGLKITSHAGMNSGDIPKPKVPMNESLLNKNATDKESLINSPIPNIILLQYQLGKGYQQSKEINISKDNECKLIFRDAESNMILQPSFHQDNMNLGKIKKYNDSVYIFSPTGEIGKHMLKGVIDGNNFDLLLNISSTWLLEGIFGYTDPHGNTDNRLEFITLYIYLKDFFGEWSYANEITTDVDGYFSLLLTETDVLVQAISKNWYSFSFFTDGHFDPGTGESSFYHHFSVSIENNGNFDDVYIPTQYTTITEPYWKIAGGFNICNIIRNGYHNFGYYMPFAVPVYHDDTDNSISNSSYGSFSISGVCGIIIGGRGSNSPPYPFDWDQWDSSVVLHEYGHAFMDQNMELPPLSGISHYYFQPSIDSVLKVAFVEGWAEFYSGVANTNKFLTDYGNDMTLRSIINLEQPFPDVPYAQSLQPSGPPSPYPHFEGGHVEGSITEALWDIYDDNDDGEYYLGSDLWGHNMDFNSSSNWNGLSKIIEVLANYDPQPDNPDHNFCWNIYEFINGWRTMGYPVDQTFIDIFEAHGVPVFLPGDADDNGSINILDVVYIINYKYKNGPAPNNPSSADVLADCVIDILDVTYLMDYKYKGGPAPMAGCINLY